MEDKKKIFKKGTVVSFHRFGQDFTGEVVSHHNTHDILFYYIETPNRGLNTWGIPEDEVTFIAEPAE